jgi:ubiquinone/menaquinone biosynthesis C-methylase UbiE
MSLSQTEGAERIDAQQAYELWARSYDTTPNPLLALEERSLLSVFGNPVSKNIVDLGCGTGRWLTRLEQSSAASLTGVDSSAAMLAEARRKCRPSTRLVHASCTATSLPDRQTDFVLASFLLSYIEDLEKFADEAARILRPGGTLIVADIHPDAVSYGWRRTFRSPVGVFEIETYEYSLQELFSAMAGARFLPERVAEPCFGDAEAAIFRKAGKYDSFLQVQGMPVIYWARFTSAAS